MTNANRQAPPQLEQWKRALSEGIAGELADWLLANPVAHWGYEGDERPIYGRCRCSVVVRADRLDLLREHLLACIARSDEPFALHGWPDPVFRLD